MNLNKTLDELRPSTIVTIAGAGLKDGIPAKEADAAWPLGIVRRSDGHLIVVDYWGNRLWRIDQEGILHKFAGDGVPGYAGDGGPAIHARFNQPHDLTIDKEDNIYLSDLGNDVYRKIDSDTGIITTIAGSGKKGRGGDGGPATEAEMDTHCGIAIDNEGNIYLSSEWANNIRKIDSKTGIIDLFAGQEARHHPSEHDSSRPFSGDKLSLGGYSGDGGPKENAGFYHPEHLALGSKGDLYVCDNSNDRIRKIDMKTGIVTTVLGNGQRASNGDGFLATEASTLMPDALFIDVNENIYVGEKYGFRVRKVEAKTGVVTTIAGTGVPGMGAENVPATETECNSIEVGMWADPDGTVLYSDCGGRVRRIDGKTGIVSTVFGGTTIHDGELATKAFLCGPRGLSVGPCGDIYFADTWSQRIRAIDSKTGIIRTVAGNGTRAYGGDGGLATEAYLGNPHHVSVDSQGRVVIADTRHGHVRRVDKDGIIHNVAGASFQWDKGDGGPAICANLVHVISVIHDSRDNIFLGDAIGRIRKIDSQTSIITTVAGIGLSGYNGDHGPATKAKIGSPADFAFDTRGNLYFADSSQHVVRKINNRGIIVTIAGTGEKGFSPDGTRATEAKLNEPSGVTVSRGGSVLIADTYNHLVRKIADDGTLQTVAGSESAGYDGDGSPANAASLNSPHGLCIYGDNFLLISDHFNHRVRSMKLI